MGIHQAKRALGRKRAGTTYTKKQVQTTATDLEKQLRDLEKQAADGTLKAGTMSLNI